MRAVIQRVLKASVAESQIGPGLLVFVGVGKEDTERDVQWMAEKIANLRIFGDDSGKMNFSVLDTKGEVLVVSQFTLYGDCRRGRRPDYLDAATPEKAKPLYEAFVAKLRGKGLSVKTGVFQAHMIVSLENDGPITLILDTKRGI